MSNKRICIGVNEMFFDKSGEEINREDLIPRKDFERLQQVVDVHQDYLNTLYVFYKFKPTPFLERIRDFIATLRL